MSSVLEAMAPGYYTCKSVASFLLTKVSKAQTLAGSPLLTWYPFLTRHVTCDVVRVEARKLTEEADCRPV